MQPVRVMIVEDSATARAFLAGVVASDSRLAVVAECATAEQAIRLLEGIRPDVISMDVHLPGMTGLDATRRIMEIRPTPIVIVSRSICAEELDATIGALAAGAVSAVEKPNGRSAGGAASASARICRELFAMSQVKVVRQRFNRPRQADARKADAAVGRPHGSANGEKPSRIAGIVASTGGPRAVETILQAVGGDFALPIVLVQHLTAGFHRGFVDWLNRTVPQTVREACHGEVVEAGHVYVAPNDAHVLVRGDRLALERSDPVSCQRPSGTMLFESMADAVGAQGIGVLLTGMGDDGAQGLLALRQAGGYTIAEDESTAVVNGMPQVARNLGAVCASLPLESIGPALKSVGLMRREVCA